MRTRRLTLPLLTLLLTVASACAPVSRGMQFMSRNLVTQFDGSLPAPAPRKPSLLAKDSKKPRLSATWIGHATLLVRMGTHWILTDPVFTENVGRVSKRLVAPGMTPEELPRLDAVLVSHMHFDHLSLESLRMIAPKATRLFVPEGGSLYLPRALPIQSQELHWGETWTAPDGRLRITGIQVQHYGFRYAGDRNWMPRAFTGYVIESDGFRVFFGGDTGYHPELFKAVRARFSSIDLAILPIAPIEPREFMRYSHIDPREAVQVFQDLGARRLVPMHYDTFLHSLEAPGVALPRLYEEAQLAGLAPSRIVAPQIGETLEIPRD